VQICYWYISQINSFWQHSS